jgi:hypothetical protein
VPQRTVPELICRVQLYLLVCAPLLPEHACGLIVHIGGRQHSSGRHWPNRKHVQRVAPEKFLCFETRLFTCARRSCGSWQRKRKRKTGNFFPVNKGSDSRGPICIGPGNSEVGGGACICFESACMHRVRMPRLMPGLTTASSSKHRTQSARTTGIMCCCGGGPTSMYSCG